MKKIHILSAITIIAAAAIPIMLVFIPRSTAEVSNSQGFAPNRFILVAAEVNVDSPQMGMMASKREVMIRMDTFTGMAWILQLDVSGGNGSKVRSSRWQELGYQQNSQLQQGFQQQGFQQQGFQ